MIRYRLACADCEGEFDAWFASSEAYDRLAELGELGCALCGGTDVAKAIMAPSIARTDPVNQDPVQAFQRLAAKARRHVAETHDYVGDRFAEEARAMHFGGKETRPIWGETTPDQAESLRAEGVPAAPLPKSFVPPVPGQGTPKKLS